jgi:protein-tyrosine phosphatase
MQPSTFSRQIVFETIFNFRDLGGFQAKGGQTVRRGRLFRSADLCKISGSDFNRLKNEIGINSVIDLRSKLELERQGQGVRSESGIRHYHVSFMSDEGDKTPNEQLFHKYSNMGEFYLYLISQKGFGRRIVEALELIAIEQNLPLIFHCAVGKDRTGMLAALLLSSLGVADADIMDDYASSTPYMEILQNRFKTEPPPPGGPQELPDYFWKATPQSMALFLSSIKKEFGSAKGFMEAHGAQKTLVANLEKALLE